MCIQTINIYIYIYIKPTNCIIICNSNKCNHTLYYIPILLTNI